MNDFERLNNIYKNNFLLIDNYQSYYFCSSIIAIDYSNVKKGYLSMYI